MSKTTGLVLSGVAVEYGRPGNPDWEQTAYYRLPTGDVLRITTDGLGGSESAIVSDDEAPDALSKNEDNTNPNHQAMIAEDTALTNSAEKLAGKLKQSALEEVEKTHEEYTPEWHAALAEAALAAGTDYLVDGDPITVADLLANLMHFCDVRGIDFDVQLGRANRHYEDEQKPVAGTSAPQEIPEGKILVSWPYSQNLLTNPDAELIVAGPLYTEYGDMAFLVDDSHADKFEVFYRSV